MYIVFIKKIDGVKISKAVLENHLVVRRSLFPIPTIKIKHTTYTCRKLTTKFEKAYYRDCKMLTPFYFRNVR